MQVVGDESDRIVKAPWLSERIADSKGFLAQRTAVKRKTNLHELTMKTRRKRFRHLLGVLRYQDEIMRQLVWAVSQEPGTFVEEYTLKLTEEQKAPDMNWLDYQMMTEHFLGRLKLVEYTWFLHLATKALTHLCTVADCTSTETRQGCAAENVRGTWEFGCQDW